MTLFGRLPYLIAEIGVNHDGNVDRAAELISGAATAAFDAVKFQYWIVDELLAEVSPNAPYQGEGDQRALLASLELSLSDLRNLKEIASELGIDFIVTPDGERACRDILGLNPIALKIGSGDADNPWLLETAAGSGLPVIVSTGMMTDRELVDLGERLSPVKKAILLHCVSAYPTPLAMANLGRMKRIGELSGRPVGFSDHTLGIAASAAAVALGASVIEKHVTWSPSAPGPDHAASLPITDATAWVTAVRDAAVGASTAIPCPNELENRSVVRKALYAKHDLDAGQVIELEHLVPLRPLIDGIPAGDRDRVVGRRLARPIRAGTRLSWEYIQA